MASRIEQSGTTPLVTSRAAASSGRWDRFLAWWDAIETGVTGILIGGALALVTYTVVMRYVAPAYAPDFTEEVTVYAVMWSVLLAAGRVSLNREHVRADLVVGSFSARTQHMAAIAANLAGAVFSLFLVVYGGLVAYEAWDFGDLSPTNLRFPLWIYYACLPVAGVLIGVGHLLAAGRLMRRPGEGDPSATSSA
ncbi:TRAP transporter small permease [Marinivivus vitaminiproducens]|uniref:TRAP transporter small permease n=1 Tax=Marinivivus vitaminiproducens TaxID=3035935 RepID=UPI002797D7C2|nr:TRAP transporter small permease [Geminicoccaceae bacterium SCSIO 64248]